jgi:hypothetical protein
VSEKLKNAHSKGRAKLYIPQPLLPTLGEGELKFPSIPLSQYWERSKGV